MNQPSRKLEWLVWGGLALIIATIGGAFILSKLKSVTTLPAIGEITDFNLTNQDGAPVTLANLRGRPWVADVIFTRCAGPCPTMTHELAQLQAALPADSPAKIVTLTSDPENDTPPVLKKYATRFNADSNRWLFLTGPKAEIRRLAVNDFKFVVVEKKPGEREAPEDLFIHSAWFVLVDKQGKVRGWTDHDGSLHAYYDSTDPATRGQILSALAQLQREP